MRRDPGQAEELSAGALIRPEHASVDAGHDPASWLPDATHHHAEMFRLDHHADSHRIHGLDDGVRDLSGHSLLHLGTARHDFGNTRQLADAHDSTPRHISNVDHAEER